MNINLDEVYRKLNENFDMIDEKHPIKIYSELITRFNVLANKNSEIYTNLLSMLNLKSGVLHKEILIKCLDLTTTIINESKKQDNLENKTKA